MRLRRYEIWGPPWYHAEATPAYKTAHSGYRVRRARAFTLSGARRRARRLENTEGYNTGTFNVIALHPGSPSPLGVTSRDPQ